MEEAARRSGLRVDQLANSLAKGVPLSEGMGQMTDLFRQDERELIELGENSGRLDFFLSALAKDIEFELSITNQLAKKGLYLALALHLICLGASFSPSEYLTSTASLGFLTAAVLVIAGFAIAYLYRYAISAWFLKIVERIPILADIFAKFELAGFFRSFTALIDSGSDTPSAFASALLAVRSESVKRGSTRSSTALAEGKSLTTVLEPLLSAAELRKVKMGEDTGELIFQLADLSLSLNKDGHHSLQKVVTRFSAILNLILVICLVGLFFYFQGGHTDSPTPANPVKSNKPTPLKHQQNIFQVEGVNDNTALVKLGEEVTMFALSSTVDYKSADRAEIVAKRLNKFYGAACSVCGEYKVLPRDLRVGRYSEEQSPFGEIVIFFAHIDNGRVLVPPILILTVPETESAAKEVSKLGLASYWRDLARTVLALSLDSRFEAGVLDKQLLNKVLALRHQLGPQAGINQLNKSISKLTAKERYRLRNSFEEVPSNYVGGPDSFPTLRHQNGKIEQISP